MRSEGIDDLEAIGMEKENIMGKQIVWAEGRQIITTVKDVKS